MSPAKPRTARQQRVALKRSIDSSGKSYQQNEWLGTHRRRLRTNHESPHSATTSQTRVRFMLSGEGWGLEEPIFNRSGTDAAHEWEIQHHKHDQPDCGPALAEAVRDGVYHPGDTIRIVEVDE